MSKEVIYIELCIDIINEKTYYTYYITKEGYSKPEIKQKILIYSSKYREYLNVIISGDKPLLETYKKMIENYLK
jgi:hypothetical protein